MMTLLGGSEHSVFDCVKSCWILQHLWLHAGVDARLELSPLKAVLLLHGTLEPLLGGILCRGQPPREATEGVKMLGVGCNVLCCLRHADVASMQLQQQGSTSGHSQPVHAHCCTEGVHLHWDALQHTVQQVWHQRHRRCGSGGHDSTQPVQVP